MIFAHPIAWTLFLLAIPIILFYILKVRLRQEPVSTTIFWRQVFEERRSRSFWRRLRHLISLLLSLLFLSLLGFAVLDPIFNTKNKPTRCVLVVDNSASMNTANTNTAFAGTTRLEQAKAEIARLLSTADLARQTALLTAGGNPQIVVGFTDHLGTLRRGVDSIAPTDGPTRLKKTIQLARQLIASEEHSSIWVYTDGCSEDLAELKALPNVSFFPVGKPVDNLAITRFQPRRSLGDAVGYEILVESVYFGTETIEARLEIDLDDRIVDVVPLVLEPNRAQTTIVRDTTPDGGLLRAIIKSTDESKTDLFATDDSACAFLPPRPIQQIYFYGEEDFFLEKVLQSQPNTAVKILPEPPKVVPNGAVLIVHRTVPETLPKGDVFIVDPRNSCDLFDVGETLEMPIVAKEQTDSPLMKFVHLNNLMIHGARNIVLKLSPETETTEESDSEHRSGNPGMSGRQILAETPESAPVYMNWQTKDQNVVLLSADLKRSDLALRTAFPIMISQALMQFRGSGGELEKAYSTGEAVRIELKTEAEQVVLKSPSGKRQTCPVKSGFVSVSSLPECGVWEICESVPKSGDTDKNDAEPTVPLLRIACNLADAAESNLKSAPDSFYEQKSEAASLRTGARPIWFWLALSALFFTAVEWFLYQRRWID